MKNSRILIVGATGSLGKKLIDRWIQNNEIMNISRDEEKQWHLRNAYPTTHLRQVIADANNYSEVKSHVYSFDPHFIIYAAASKHIDVCEKQPTASIRNNFTGITVVLNDIQSFREKYQSLAAFLFVSTDKACLPITVYGQTKAISEKLVQTINIPGVRSLCVRYGNVLNSRGSILPLLHKIGQDSTKKEFQLTHVDMTRFIMRLDESAELIEHSIQNGKNGEVIIPMLKSCRIKDMIELFSKLYNKSIIVSGLRCVEKIHEDLLSSYESAYTYIFDNKYIHLTTIMQESHSNYSSFSSADTLIDKEELESYLRRYSYLD